MKASDSATIELASLKERKKERKKEEGEKSIFDGVWFSMQTAALEGAAMCTGSISLVGYDNDS